MVVVGDRKQLPPTNSRYVRRALLDEEFEEGELELEDNESILELADKVLDGRSCSLGWHYRSRHQSLINFSNYHFYDNKLTVFASMDVQSAVHLRQVESPQYSSQVNLPEVLEVIDEIKKQVSRSHEVYFGCNHEYKAGCRDRDGLGGRVAIFSRT